MYIVQSGWGLVGWGGAITFMKTWTRMDWDLLLHFHTHVMLRSGIFFCACTHTSCYALGSFFALAHTRHAMLWDLLLDLHTHTHTRHATLWDLFLHLQTRTHTHVMLRSGIFSCNCTHTRHATLWDLLLHLHTHTRHATLWDLLLHLQTHTSCYALGSSFALAHTRHATLWDLLLHLHTHVMLRSGIFSCTCTHA